MFYRLGVGSTLSSELLDKTVLRVIVAKILQREKTTEGNYIHDLEDITYFYFLTKVRFSV